MAVSCVRIRPSQQEQADVAVSVVRRRIVQAGTPVGVAANDVAGRLLTDR